MALVDILEKIEKDTTSKIAELEKSFEEKKKKLEEESEKQQKEIDENMNQKVEEKSAKILEKAATLAAMEAKNQLLQAKRKIIEAALENAIETLVNSDKYEEILSSMLKKADIDGDVEVVPAKGKEDSTKKAITSSGKNYSLADKSANIQGGFILKTEKIEIDNSFETIIKKQLREDLEINVHKLLFT